MVDDTGDTKRDFSEGKCDILYRVKRSGTGSKFGGWRSYRKALKKGNPPWPWDMAGSPYISEIEWKVQIVDDGEQ